MKVVDSGGKPENLGDPLDPVWEGVGHEIVPLAPAPVEGQPSRYVQTVYSAVGDSRVRQVDVKAARSGDGTVFVRLEWDDSTPDREHKGQAFPDAAAVMFPWTGDAPLAEMGSDENPVSLWYWRPDLEGECEVLVAKGLGTVERVAADGLKARSAHSGDRWSVVIAGSAPPDASKVAFALWEGAAGERAGLKSASEGWHDLEVAQ